MRALRLLALAVVAIALSGCQLVPGQRPGPDPVTSLDGTAWRAVDVAGQPPVDGAAPTIRFEGDRLSGSTGCNTFGAGYGRVDARFRLGELIITEIGCGGLVGEQERRFLAALGAAERIAVAGASLELSGPAGNLSFVPDPGAQ